MLVNFSCLFILLFYLIVLFKNFYQEYYQSVSNSLDQGQARGFVGFDIGPNCLQRLSEADTL